MKFILDPANPLAGYIEWNPETGEITGPMAPRVIDAIEEVIEDGGLVSDPYPAFYPVRRPYRSPAELAVILYKFFTVPDQLKAAHAALIAQKIADTDDGGPGVVY
jgi:hypothetical protein